MEITVTTFDLFFMLALLAFIFGATVDQVFFWLLVFVLCALFIPGELSVRARIDAQRVTISYPAQKASIGEKGGL